MAENSVTLVGNLTRDPELRYTPSGQATVQFGMAVNRRYQVNGDWREEVSYFNVVVWREQAENIAECLTKGTRVIVTGRLQQRSWETQDGDKRSVVEIVADEVGPSLRWAKAEVTRISRNGEGSAPRQSSRPAPSVPAEDIDHDPFGDDDQPF